MLISFQKFFSRYISYRQDLLWYFCIYKPQNNYIFLIRFKYNAIYSKRLNESVDSLKNHFSFQATK